MLPAQSHAQSPNRNGSYNIGFVVPDLSGLFFGRMAALIKAYFPHPELGESRQLLRRDGTVVAGNLGNPRKGIYHTGRALAETIRRLDALTEGA